MICDVTREPIAPAASRPVKTESAKEPPGDRSHKPTPGEFAIIDVLTGNI
jgi:hypothetical protein